MIPDHRLDGPSPAAQVARDLVRKGLLATPPAVALGALAAGADGAASVGYGMAIIVANFLLSASLLAWASRISFTLVAAAALGGYLLRLALVFAAVWLVKDAPWVDLVVLGATIISSHLGLLVWELRAVSASMAYPGLKPTTTRRPAASTRR